VKIREKHHRLAWLILALNQQIRPLSDMFHVSDSILSRKDLQRLQLAQIDAMRLVPSSKGCEKG
jgi:hypothetical protein